MKTMTCNQLAGSCDQEFTAETFDKIGEMSRSHAMEMVNKGDEAHTEKMDEMKTLMMKDPNAAKEWYAAKQAEFDALPEDE